MRNVTHLPYLAEPAHVPGFSADWYRAIVGFADRMPGWLQGVGNAFTELAIILLFGILVVGWWRARRRDDRAMALALLGPLSAVLAYLSSELLKSGWGEQRPCRVFDRIRTIAECPHVGDWSFPSNHSTIAAAATVALVLTWRRMTLLALPVAVLAGFSRVFVGVHYPHDVLGGFVLGTVVATVIMLALVRPVRALVSWMREYSPLRTLLVGAGTGERPVQAPREPARPGFDDAPTEVLRPQQFDHRRNR